MDLVAILSLRPISTTSRINDDDSGYSIIIIISYYYYHYFYYIEFNVHREETRQRSECQNRVKHSVPPTERRQFTINE